MHCRKVTEGVAQRESECSILLKPTDHEQKDIFGLLLRRRKKLSTIFCSQYVSDGCYEQLCGIDSPSADAILDRIVHDAYKINIEAGNPSKNISMRAVFSMDMNHAQ